MELEPDLMVLVVLVMVLTNSAGVVETGQLINKLYGDW
jgi:hypothetical protein